MKKILITGGSGKLGSYTAAQAAAAGWDTYALYSSHPVEIPGCTMIQADIRNGDEIMQVVSNIHPDAIIHTAAMAKPDECERSKTDTYAVNVTGTTNIISAAESVDAFITYVSTDLIFNGNNSPHKTDDTPGPVNYYGMTKLAGETAVQAARVPWSIVRTSVIYGPRKFAFQESFTDRIVELLSAGKPMAAFVDQYRAAIPVWNLADAILEIASRQLTGAYHVACPELTTRFQFARRVAQEFGLDRLLVEPIYMDSAVQEARRPKMLALDMISTASTLKTPLLTFEEGIHELKKRMEDVGP